MDSVISVHSSTFFRHTSFPSIQLTYTSHDKGAMGVITRTGGTIGLFGELSDSIVHQIRNMYRNQLTLHQPLWALDSHTPKQQ